MINRGRVPDPKPLPRPWKTGEPPCRGDYLVVDGWLSRTVGAWTPEQGWCIRGRWLGHEAAACWCELPTIPESIKQGDW